jgi:hypothetical protein
MILETLLYGNPVPGYPSLMVVVLFLGGVQLMALIGVTLRFLKAKTRRARVSQQILDFFIRAGLQCRGELSIVASIALAGRNRRYRHATSANRRHDARMRLRNSKALSKRLSWVERLSRASS